MKRFVVYLNVTQMENDRVTVRGTDRIAIHDRRENRYALYQERHSLLAHVDVKDLNEDPSFVDEFVWVSSDMVR